MLQARFIAEYFARRKHHGLRSGIKKAFLHCGFVKDTMNVLKPEFYHMSPALGCALVNSHWLSNVYQTSPEYMQKSNVGQLVKSLFHKESPRDTLHVTKNKSNAPAWLTPERVASIIAHLEDADKAKDDLKKCISKWAKESKITKKRVQEFVDLVVNANKECEHAATEKKPMFPKYMVHSILLAFMWERTQAKTELVPYYQKLHNMFAALTDSDRLNDLWVSSKFDRLEPDPIDINTPGAYELAVQMRLVERYVREVPPKPQSHSFAEFNDVGDCAECAVRGVINLMVFDPEGQVFDTTLISSNAQPMQALKDFYSGVNSNGIARNLVNTELASKETARAWYNVISNIPGVRYDRTRQIEGVEYKYELYPGADNLLKVFNKLLGVDAPSFPELATIISTPQVHMTCQVVTYRITFTFQYAFGFKLVATLEHENSHASVNYQRGTIENRPPVSLWEGWICQRHSLSPVLAPLMCLSSSKNFLAAFSEQSPVCELTQVQKWHMLNSMMQIEERPTEQALVSLISFLLSGEVSEHTLREVNRLLGFVSRTHKEQFIRKIYRERLHESGDIHELITANVDCLLIAVSLASAENNLELLRKLLLHRIAPGLVGDLYRQVFQLDDFEVYNYVRLARSDSMQLAIEYGSVNILAGLLTRNPTWITQPINKQLPLIFAVQCNQVKILRLLLERGCSIDYQDANNRTLLHFAASYKAYDIAEELLERGANPNAVTIRNESPFHISARIGDVKMMELLLSKGASVNLASSYNMTALHIAAQNSDLKIIQLLLQHKADKKAANQFGQTPLALLNDKDPKNEQLKQLLSDEPIAVTSAADPLPMTTPTNAQVVMQ